MSETSRLLDTATRLSRLLLDRSIPHAFYGSVLSATLANSMYTNEIYCIVEGGRDQPHPFRRARDAVSGKDDWTSTHSPWTNRYPLSLSLSLLLSPKHPILARLHVTYRAFTPPIEIEILPAGETGPRHLDDTNVMKIQGIPFLNVSEFLRAKLKAWMIRGAEGDAHDIVYMLTRFWNRVDINRIPEQDMNHFVSRNNTAAAAWSALRRKYGM